MAFNALLDSIISGPDLALQINAEFDRTYQNSYDAIDKWLGVVMELDKPSTKRRETYGLIESMPTPSEWRRGDPIPTEATGTKRFTVENFTYGKRIGWHREDREDSEIGDILGRFRALADRMALVAVKAAVEYINGTASLLPVLYNAPDGAALFSTTDGDSAARFGITDGNIVTGTGTTAIKIEADFFSAVTRFGQFLDTKGEPYFEPNIMQEQYTAIFPVTMMAAVMEAFRANLIHATGTSTSDTGAARSSLILASGVNIQIFFTSRLASPDWYLFRGDAQTAPLFEQSRRPIQEESALAEGQNSDEVRNTGREYIQYSVRKGYGVNVPFGAMKVNNT